jgi:hypothetical protein
MSPKIVIVILNWNRRDDTLACLHSVVGIDYPAFETVVVDNGSNDDSVAAIRGEFPGISILETKKNLGYAGGNNVGITSALKRGADLVFLLNNDTVVDPQILKTLAEAMERWPEAGVFGARPLVFGGEGRLDSIGGVWNQESCEFDLKETATGEELDYVSGCAIAVRRRVFEQVGLLEPNFFLFWEEADFCMRARRAGFPLKVVEKAKVWHKGSASFIGGKPHIAYFWWRGRFLWIERNLPRRDRWRATTLVLLPKLLHIGKLYLVKKTTFSLTRWWMNETRATSRRHELRHYHAALRGAWDYWKKRFGNVPQDLLK